MDGRWYAECLTCSAGRSSSRDYHVYDFADEHEAKGHKVKITEPDEEF